MIISAAAKKAICPRQPPLRLMAMIAFLLFPLRLSAQGLQEQLERESASRLAQDALDFGDAQRGAIQFHQPQIACSTCHATAGDQQNSLGPDLAVRAEGSIRLSNSELVDAVLRPSQSIAKGYQTIAILTSQGEIHTALLVEQNADEIVVRPAQPGAQLQSFSIAEIEEAKILESSLMPAGQVNQLQSRQNFLDLIRYLMEIRDGGRSRAEELQPSKAHLTLQVPEFEQSLDHNGFIDDWNADSMARGQAIYMRVCANCHGTHEQAGSLPTSLRFAEGKFKNGSDPYSMYRTLTYGFGLMTPQTWMVPSQKYDVIHYIREAYLRNSNPEQFSEVTPAYLAGLPRGDQRGPAPSAIEPWSAMDYGPSLTHTYEVPGPKHNIAYKGLAVRLDPGAGGVSRGRNWMLFDTDTLRVAAGWSGSGQAQDNFIDWQSIQFNGVHGRHPQLVGQVAFSNATGPGWANPEDGQFTDNQRVLGRDGRFYGPLPAAWAKFHGVYHHDQDVVLAYSVGKAEILESPGLAPPSSVLAAPIFTRTFNIGPRQHELVLRVAEHAAPDARLTMLGTDDAPIVQIAAPPNLAAEEQPWTFAGETYLEIADAQSFDVQQQDFSVSARIRTRSDGTLWCVTQPGPKWVPNGQSFFVRGGRLGFDIGWVGAVMGKSRVDDGEWHDVLLTWQQANHQVELFVDGKLDGAGRLAAKADLPGSVMRIGFTAPNFPAQPFFTGEIEQLSFYQRRISATADRPLPNKAIGSWQPSAAAAAGQRLIPDASGQQHDANLQNGGQQARPSPGPIVAGVAPHLAGLQWTLNQGHLELKIPAGQSSLKFTLWLCGDSPAEDQQEWPQPVANLFIPQADRDLSAWTHGGPPRWPQLIDTVMEPGSEQGPLAVDVLHAPESNPWLSLTRFTGLDFFRDGRIAICDWDGNVWIVTEQDRRLRWQRIASGLFQPLGLKVIDDVVHVTCRDQLAVLHDLNGDQEIDFYECLNNDHQVTEHFHEFAMGLQVDSAGNFYYAKSGEHGKPAVVPHHGTLLQVSPDGQRTTILANGFRAANGVCLNPDGSFVVTDQEGFWNPKNRINWVTLGDPGKPKFYGNMLGYHTVTDTSDQAMEQPLCWITNNFDRSPGELLWVDSPRWGPLNGSLLNLSYGTGKIFLVLHERVNNMVQGGMLALPIPDFPTGVMRGRFHPLDQQLYACGMFAWAGNATHPGGLYRIRATGRPLQLPIELHATRSGLRLVFTGPLQPESVRADQVQVKSWSLERSAKYGSEHFDERELEVFSSELNSDGKIVELHIRDIKPTWCMSIEYRFKAVDGTPVTGLIHNTIHQLQESSP